MLPQTTTLPMSENIKTLNRDIMKSTHLLSDKEARYVVDLYYQLQEYRKRAANQNRAMSEAEEPTELVHWLFGSFRLMESSIKNYLGHYSKTRAVGRWSNGLTGIGPVISAGLMAHIDMVHAHKKIDCNCCVDIDERDRIIKLKNLKNDASICAGHPIETVGHIWSFAGILGRDPETGENFQKWEKGQKRPHNAKLKTLVWKIGQSFVKVSNKESDVYGKIYKARKEFEIGKNDRLEYADQAKQKLEKFRIGKTTEAYKHYSQGKLPPGHIQQRAERYSAKIFLSHWHAVAYYEHFGKKAPKPFAIAELGHAHMVDIPNWPFRNQVE